MKKFLLAVIFLWGIIGSIYSQEVRKAASPVISYHYDGMTNFAPDSIRKYIGQSIYIIPRSSSDDDFILYGDSFFGSFSGTPIAYDNLQGKNFRIVDFIDKEKDGGVGLYFTLKPENGGDNIYYMIVRYRGHLRESMYAPFIVSGFLNKQKELYLNKKLFVKTSSWDIKLNDINTGLPVKINKGDEWECTSFVYMDDKSSSILTPSFILKNNKGEEIALPLKEFTGKPRLEINNIF